MLRVKSGSSVLSAVVVVAVLMSAAAAQGSLIAYWNMDEGTGTTVGDSSGNSHTASLVGTGGWTTAGRFGNAITVVHATDSPPVSAGYVQTDATLPALGTGDFTVSLWFKGAAGDDGWRCLYETGVDSNNALQIVTHAPDVGDLTQAGIRVEMGPYFTDALSSEPLMDMTDTDWYHVAVTRSGTTVTAYVNGKFYNDGTSSASVGGYTGYFGYVPSEGLWGVHRGMTGAMDDIAVWNQALTPAQIKALYDGAATPLNIVPEPSSALLLSVALLGLLAYAWRKRR